MELLVLTPVMDTANRAGVSNTWPARRFNAARGLNVTRVRILCHLANA